MAHIKSRRHIVIPDTQVRPGVKTDHLVAAGQYIADWKPDVVVHLGDHYDLHSLNSYERGELQMEGTDVLRDIEAGNDALASLTKAIRSAKNYHPRLVLLRGNHENRLARARQNNPRLSSLLDERLFGDRKLGWEVHNFLKVVTIDGILYSHYFYAPGTGRAYGGSAGYKLGKIHASFTMGHVQGLDVGRVELPDGRRLRGLVAGSFYQHDEEYKGPQGNSHWRGILVKHEVQNGNYDLTEVSLSYLLRKYT